LDEAIRILTLIAALHGMDADGARGGIPALDRHRRGSCGMTDVSSHNGSKRRRTVGISLRNAQEEIDASRPSIGDIPKTGEPLQVIVDSDLARPLGD
jgi:hypothetical protein